MRPDLDATLVALADRNRRAIVEFLRERPLRPSEVADALAMSRPAVSRHLRILRAAGLIEQNAPDHDARARVIQLRQEPFAQVRAWIEQVESFWGDQLGAFRAHAERTHKRRRP